MQKEKNDFEKVAKDVNIFLPKDKYYYDVSDIMKIRQCKEKAAYIIIKNLNKELETKGFLTDKGRVSIKYYHERYNI